MSSVVYNLLTITSSVDWCVGSARLCTVVIISQTKSSSKNVICISAKNVSINCLKISPGLQIKEDTRYDRG